MKDPLPIWIERFIERIAPPELSESILGDLEEEFHFNQKSIGRKKAGKILFFRTIGFFRPGILFRNKFSKTPNLMFRNHLKIGFRSILKQKLYSTINAVGLAIAIAFCTLIFLYIQDEKSFDQWHTKKERIYRINGIDYNERGPDQGEITYYAHLQTGLAPKLEEEAPEVEMATRFSAGYNAVFRREDKVFSEEFTYTDPQFFEMFDFKVVAGDPKQFLNDQSEIILTESTAKKYFDTEDPVGKTLELQIRDENKSFTIAGIIEDPPANSSLDYKAALVRQELRPYYERNLPQWTNWNTPTFVLLKKSATSDQLLQSLDAINRNYVIPAQNNPEEEEEPEEEVKPAYNLTAFPDVHLDNRVSWKNVSDPRYSYILSGIGLLILLIACINYITLAITSASGKKLEVGIRKAVGSQRSQLIGQFLTESMLLSFLALIISGILVVVFLPYFNEFTEKAISLSNSVVEVGIAIISFSIIIGMLAGIYPAFYLSGFKPVSMLRGRTSSRFSSRWSQPLVVIQFAISAFLILSSIVMYQQMNYITTKDLGYSGDQVLVLPTYTGYSEEGEKTLNRFRQVARGNPDILSVTGTNASFNRGWSRNGYDIDDEYHYAYVYRIDPKYIPTLDIELVEGRNFDADRVSDKGNAIIVNEKLVEDMGWEDPLNERLAWRRDSIGDQVIGVVKDYHFLSLEEKVEPMILSLNDDVGMVTTLLIKLNGEDLQAGVSSVQDIWTQLAPDKPFDYNFMDEDIDRQYASYTKWSNIMGLTTIFAILIACLGLFGLAGLNALNRTKEIGIRKAMGAEIKHILVLMNRPFLIMSVISFIIAAPVSWYVMKEWWLSGFEYSINLNANLFIYSFLIVLFFALITVSYHALKSCFINPAETLKTES